MKIVVMFLSSAKLKISKFADNARVIYKFSMPPIQNYPTFFFEKIQ